MDDPLLRSALKNLRMPGVTVAHRLIALGDEHALMPQEAPAFAKSVEKVRRASGAARIVARELLASLGHPGWPLPKGTSGAPVWPPGVIGSLAHDRSVAIAAVARRGAHSGLGLDVEPAEALPADLLDVVATAQERARIEDDPYRGRLLFVAKEAVYKAVHPLDGIFLEHHDVEVSLREGKAKVRNGRVVELRWCLSTHIVAVAWVAA